MSCYLTSLATTELENRGKKNLNSSYTKHSVRYKEENGNKWNTLTGCVVPATTSVTSYVFPDCTTDCIKIQQNTILAPEKQLMKAVCVPGYTVTGNDTAICNCGKWSKLPVCTSECGKTSAVLPLVMHGTRVSNGQWPWTAAFYYNESTEYLLFCGGTLITSRTVITAAHCIWNMNITNILIVFNKIHREYRKDEFRSEPFFVKETAVPAIYQDREGDYRSDIAIILLTKHVDISEYIKPACLPWNMNEGYKITSPGNLATVAGWGLDENFKTNEYLKFVRLPVVDTKECFLKIPHGFRKYFSYTTICAGFLNGTGVCNGDSGSGLLIPRNRTWYLHGIVSLSPRETGTSHCAQNSYTLFTKVNMYIPWIHKILKKWDNLP